MKEQELEQMADSIEAKLRAHDVNVRVVGGTTLPYHVRLNVHLGLGTRISRIKGLVADGVLGASAQASRRGAFVVITIRRKNAATVAALLDDIEPVRFTVALGVEERKDSSAPLLVNLESESQTGAHILIVGQERNELLTIVTESLRRWNEPQALQTRWIDGEGSLTVDTIAGRKEKRPVLVLLTNGGGITPALRRLMARRTRNGVHVILTIETDYADDKLRSLFPCRIRGLGGGSYEARAEDWAGMFYTPRIEAELPWPGSRLARVFAGNAGGEAIED